LYWLEVPLSPARRRRRPSRTKGNMYAYAQSEMLTGDERERLILEHLPQVRLIARRIMERLPDNVALEDLISAGVIGLISAIDHFDPAHNVKLKTYAEYKIRGAILDSLRGLDWAPRQKRRRAKQIEAAIAAAEQLHQRSPTEEEIAAKLEISVTEYHEWLVEIRGLNVASLESVPGTPGTRGKDLLRYIADDGQDLPSIALERAELERILAQAIDGIPEIERTVLSLYYREELTLREISTVIGLHESRISQLKSQAILRLRARLAERWPATARGTVNA
jgi:RNA polymerase sigma factor for flagellar operon FliA